MKARRIGSALLAAAAAAALSAADGVTPVKLANGSPPAIPVTTPGGGQVILELSVDAAGKVSESRVLRSTSVFTDALRSAVAGWSFEPATQDGGAVVSRVLVAELIRPPTVLGPGLGEVPQDVAQASPGVPFPTQMTPPPFPPNARGENVVLLEAKVEGNGSVHSVRVVTGSAPFDKAAADTVKQWSFRHSGDAAYAYVIVGFRQPVTPAPRK